MIGNEGLEITLLLLGGAAIHDEVTPLPALAECLCNRTVATREFGHDNRLCGEIDFGAAPHLGYAQRAQAKL